MAEQITNVTLRVPSPFILQQDQDNYMLILGDARINTNLDTLKALNQQLKKYVK